MLKQIKQLRMDKVTYKNQMKRAKDLPEDYHFVFEKIHQYMWSLASDDSSPMIQAQEDLLVLFEEGASNQIHVLDITGEDVASFCDDFLRDTKKWTDRYRIRLNNAITKNVSY